ncbi:MAG: hypothetical protein M1830_003179 [Pleopsidium flavum]|nr:MAG: hypothetical protein M1830_003179 [Pleopsidium flavum]
MKFTLISLAVLLGSGLASAIPNPNSGESSGCYKCEYRQDDCGKEYGGSYNSCKGRFEDNYPKPSCRDQKCNRCEYRYDDCGNHYGGSYNSCNGGFEYYYKRPNCGKGESGGKGEKEGEGDKEHDD